MTTRFVAILICLAASAALAHDTWILFYRAPLAGLRERPRGVMSLHHGRGEQRD